MTEENPFDFRVGQICPENMRPGGGLTISMPLVITQQLAAVSAFNNFDGIQEWPEKLACSYVVAITTRSADQKLMLILQRHLNKTLNLTCKGCISASIGEGLIRERLLPKLKELRESANALIHHLDAPDSVGVSGLNFQAVFEYCRLLFVDLPDLKFGHFPNPNGKFWKQACKKCLEQNNKK